MNWIIALFFLFGGCSSNILIQEAIVKEVPRAGSAITLLQFIAIIILAFLNIVSSGGAVPPSKTGDSSLISNGNWWHWIVRPAIPIHQYIIKIVLFFSVLALNDLDLALAFNVSLPLHTIFRSSGSLLANLILGIIILRESYPIYKYLSVILITSGITICTLVSTDPKYWKTADSSTDFGFRWMIGITILMLALFLNAVFGILQEITFKRYGKHPDEALFFNHFLPLPFFVFFGSDILSSFSQFSSSAPVSFASLVSHSNTTDLSLVPLVNMTMPRLWTYALLAMVTNFMFIRGLFELITECSSLTISLLITLRKFLSLLLSIYFFSKPYTATHAIGTALVLGGTLVFYEGHSHIAALVSKQPSVLSGLSGRSADKRKAA